MGRIGTFRTPLLIHSIACDMRPRFLSLMAFKENLDLNMGIPNALDYCVGVEYPYLHLLLQAGASPTMTQFHYASENWIVNNDLNWSHYCVLLSTGLDPGDIIPHERIRNEVQKWLEGFDRAKQ